MPSQRYVLFMILFKCQDKTYENSKEIVMKHREDKRRGFHVCVQQHIDEQLLHTNEMIK